MTFSNRRFWQLLAIVGTIVAALFALNFPSNAGTKTPANVIILPTITSTAVQPTPTPPHASMPQADPPRQFVYHIDRSQLPALPIAGITLKIQVGNNQAIHFATKKGESLPFELDEGIAIVTVESDELRLTIREEIPTVDLGSFEIAPLLGDKKWAWSHSFDDNVGLAAAIEAFERRNWQGTLYLIGSLVEDDREQDWIIDAPGIHALLAKGWSIGSHSWEHECWSGNHYETILLGHNRLLEVIAASPKPDYPLTAFAAPCFDADYHPHILRMRDEREISVLFNESGDDSLMRIDLGEDCQSEGVIEAWKVAEFNFDMPIGRDSRFGGDTNAILREMDWLSEQAGDCRHFWYNTLTHGDSEAAVEMVLEYAYNQFGPNGSDELWVAPADHIYSYLLTRQKAIVTQIAP